jgi:hypothetical protein
MKLVKKLKESFVLSISKIKRALSENPPPRPSTRYIFTIKGCLGGESGLVLTMMDLLAIRSIVSGISLQRR